MPNYDIPVKFCQLKLFNQPNITCAWRWGCIYNTVRHLPIKEIYFLKQRAG